MKLHIFHLDDTPSNNKNSKNEVDGQPANKFLETPEIQQKQQSTPINTTSPSTSPINNLMRRPSSLFTRDNSSPRTSISDPNKKPGLLNKVENFFKSPKRESIAVGNSLDVAVLPETDQEKILPKVPKISISHQNSATENEKVKPKEQSESTSKNVKSVKSGEGVKPSSTSSEISTSEKTKVENVKSNPTVVDSASSKSKDNPPPTTNVTQPTDPKVTSENEKVKSKEPAVSTSKDVKSVKSGEGVKPSSTSSEISTSEKTKVENVKSNPTVVDSVSSKSKDNPPPTTNVTQPTDLKVTSENEKAKSKEPAVSTSKDVKSVKSGEGVKPSSTSSEISTSEKTKVENVKSNPTVVDSVSSKSKDNPPPTTNVTQPTDPKVTSENEKVKSKEPAVSTSKDVKSVKSGEGVKPSSTSSEISTSEKTKVENVKSNPTVVDSASSKSKDNPPPTTSVTQPTDLKVTSENEKVKSKEPAVSTSKDVKSVKSGEGVKPSSTSSEISTSEKTKVENVKSNPTVVDSVSSKSKDNPPPTTNVTQPTDLKVTSENEKAKSKEPAVSTSKDVKSVKSGEGVKPSSTSSEISTSEKTKVENVKSNPTVVDSVSSKSKDNPPPTTNVTQPTDPKVTSENEKVKSKEPAVSTSKDVKSVKSGEGVKPSMTSSVISTSEKTKVENVKSNPTVVDSVSSKSKDNPPPTTNVTQPTDPKVTSENEKVKSKEPAVSTSKDVKSVKSGEGVKPSMTSSVISTSEKTKVENVKSNPTVVDSVSSKSKDNPPPTTSVTQPTDPKVTSENEKAKSKEPAVSTSKDVKSVKSGEGVKPSSTSSEISTSEKTKVENVKSNPTVVDSVSSKSKDNPPPTTNVTQPTDLKVTSENEKVKSKEPAVSTSKDVKSVKSGEGVKPSSTSSVISTSEKTKVENVKSNPTVVDSVSSKSKDNPPPTTSVTQPTDLKVTSENEKVKSKEPAVSTSKDVKSVKSGEGVKPSSTSSEISTSEKTKVENVKSNPTVVDSVSSKSKDNPPPTTNVTQPTDLKVTSENEKVKSKEPAVSTSKDVKSVKSGEGVKPSMTSSVISTSEKTKVENVKSNPTVVDSVSSKSKDDPPPTTSVTQPTDLKVTSENEKVKSKEPAVSTSKDVKSVKSGEGVKPSSTSSEISTLKKTKLENMNMNSVVVDNTSLRRDTIVLQNPKCLLSTADTVDNSLPAFSSVGMQNHPLDNSVNKLITEIEQLRGHLTKFPSSRLQYGQSKSCQTFQRTTINCSTQTYLDKTLSLSSVDCEYNQLEDNTFQLQLESLILYSLRCSGYLSKKDNCSTLAAKIKGTPSTNSNVMSYCPSVKDICKPVRHIPFHQQQQPICYFREFASSLFNTLQKEYQRVIDKFTVSDLISLNSATLTQFILQSYDIWNYDLNSKDSNVNNSKYCNHFPSIIYDYNTTDNRLAVVTTPLHHKVNIRQFCKNLLLCLIFTYLNNEQSSMKYVRIIPGIKKLLNNYLQNANSQNEYFFHKFNNLCEEKFCQDCFWFSQVTRQGLILLQPFHLEWLLSGIDLINLSNHTLQKMKFRLTTTTTTSLSNIMINKDSVFELIPPTVIGSFCRTAEIHNVIYLRTLHTNLILIPHDLTSIGKIYNRFVDAINYLSSSSSYTTGRTTSLYGNNDESIHEPNYITSQLLQLFIQLKYRVWELIIQPIVNSNHTVSFLDQLLKCIHSQVLIRLESIYSNTNHHHSKVYLFILIFRMLTSMHFESYCLIHQSRPTNALIYGFNYTVVMSNAMNCSITGPSKNDCILRENSQSFTYLLYHLYEMCYSEWLITGLWPYHKVKMFTRHQQITVQDLWFHALKQKDDLMKLLFHNNLINNYKNSLQQIVKEKSSLNIKLWLPVKFKSTDLSKASFWSRVYLASVMQWYDTNPISANCETIINKLSCILHITTNITSSGGNNNNNNSKSCPRLFLRNLEEIRCNWSNSNYINYELMYIWCLMSDDIHDCSSTSGNVHQEIENKNSDLYHPSIVFEKNLKGLPYDLMIQLKLTYFIEPSVLFTTISHKTASEYILKYSRQLVNMKSTYSENNIDQMMIENLHCQIDSLKKEIRRLQRGTSAVEERIVHVSHSSPSHFYSMDPSVDVNNLSEEKSNSLHNPSYYSAQLQELRQTGDLELVRAHLSLSERRRRELERRITELTDELARSRADARSAETSLSAARRTEAALRRRLLVAMDSRGSPNGNYEQNLVRNSHEFNTNDSSEILNVVELQADIIKLQATNASLTEAALLDRTRLHDQAMRIDQLEAEHKALLDRVSCLQAAETGAQRGIVRLQALYEDMLREYSESKPLELSSIRGRNYQRNNPRNTKEGDYISNKDYKDKQYHTASRTDQTSSEIQVVNTLRKQSVYDNSASSTTIPVGSCNSPACIAVRNLLKALQERYSDLMNQYTQIKQYPVLTNGHVDNINHDNNSIVLRKSSQTPAFIEELYTQLTNLSLLLNENNHNNKQVVKHYELCEHIKMCMRLVNLLDNWINSCLTQNDMEIAHLRSLVMNLQLRNSTFSCSISVNRKQDLSEFLLNEQELFNLREKLRLAEAQLQLTSMMQTTEISSILLEFFHLNE
ncbi:hypothetical protein KSF78_0005826 [Schistosoma japonicum]|nr:hypothetical protein KSF78_0005826 [Schistosoma japonicum]